MSTPRERILAAIQGRPNDSIPFIPRLDNWYRANKINNSLPDRFRNATLLELTDACDFGYHAINPEYLDLRTPEGHDHAGIGLYDINLTPYYVKFHNVDIDVRINDKGHTFVTYTTPKGIIRTDTVYDERMRSQGITLSVIMEHALKSWKDFPAMAYILQNAEVVVHYDGLAQFREEIMGERGLTVGLGAVYCGPYHYMIKELMGLEDFYFELDEHEDEMAEFAEQIAPFLEKMYLAAADAPCEAILCGSNYDSYVTAPGLFAEHIVPDIRKASALYHSRGKYHICHTDGENIGLLEKYLDAGFDIADSVCPAPMTKCSLKQIYDAFSGKITIWGGIPSICMLPENMKQAEFERTVDDLLSSVGDGRHFICSIADTLPPAADFDRVLYIQKKLKELGPVPGDP